MCRFHRLVFASSLLSLAGLSALAQETGLPGPNSASPYNPSPTDVSKAQTRVRDLMKRVPGPGTPELPSALPQIDALPKPAAAASDIASLAEKYKALGDLSVRQDSSEDLLVMVSLAMPKATLQRIAEQAEFTGATLVFRGLKDDSMARMGEAIKTVIGNRQVSVVIHPPAFQQFGISQVPTVVIARREAGNVLADGCSKADSFVKVAGDVSLDYALEYIERTSPDWKVPASRYRRRIVRELP